MTCIDYTFRDPQLRQRALTHRSASRVSNNEQLELLGDAVLQLIVVDHLTAHYPDAKEGWLCQQSAALVCKQHLASVARRLDIGPHLILGGSEQASGRHNVSILEDALEALIGAIYRDGGMEAARQFVVRHVVGAKCMTG